MGWRSPRGPAALPPLLFPPLSPSEGWPGVAQTGTLPPSSSFCARRGGGSRGPCPEAPEWGRVIAQQGHC